MTKYASLKDYIELNNMGVIYGGLNYYIKCISNRNDYKIAENGITIHTLAWDRFDSVSLSERYLTFTMRILWHPKIFCVKVKAPYQTKACKASVL